MWKALAAAAVARPLPPVLLVVVGRYTTAAAARAWPWPSRRPAARLASALALGTSVVLGGGAVAYAASSGAAASTPEGLAARAQALYGNAHPQVVYDLLQPHAVGKPAVGRKAADAEVLWRFARACHDLAAETADKAAKKALTYQVCWCHTLGSDRIVAADAAMRHARATRRHRRPLPWLQTSLRATSGWPL